MIISPNTIAILKSFAGINNSIMIRPGKTFRTMSTQKTIMAIAEVDEVFPSAMPIYDLTQFLNVLGLFEAPEIELDENRNRAVIRKNKSKLSYYFADDSLITSPPEKALELPDVMANFTLTKDVFRKTVSASAALGMPHWCVIGENGEVRISVTDADKTSANDYSEVVGTTEDDFRSVFRVENLKILSNDYDVRISSGGLSHFATESNAMQYFIPTEDK